MTTTVCTAEATEDLQRIMHCKSVPAGGMGPRKPGKGSGEGEGSQGEPPQRSQAEEEIDKLHDQVIGVQATLEVVAAGMEYHPEHLNEQARAYHNALLPIARVLSDTARDLSGACSYLAAAATSLQGDGHAWSQVDGASGYLSFNGRMLNYAAQACRNYSKRITGNDQPDEWEMITELSDRLFDLSVVAAELRKRLQEAGL